MKKIAKMQNYHGIIYDRQTGEPCLDIGKEEYVCTNCRHIVNQTDRYCWQCGEELEFTGDIEHHAGKYTISHEQFLHLKSLPVKDTGAFLASILPSKLVRWEDKRRKEVS